ncbi:ABC transporter permease [Roseomonas sp. E05]|uniref:ABC transporter permease n=1 Tax=Roseomonas sp. E05 TaxID=3046310 RepID=UPI0024B87A3A|nr:ABC transporter permease [Roseomonas sp. E05]MDJ0388764.1 ABC transporter permease [Roseomonas sp. E05]
MSGRRFAAPWALLGFLLLLALWEAGVRLSGVSPLILPAPSAVWFALLDGFRSGQFLTHGWVTLSEVLGGFVLGGGGGLLLGCLIGRFPLLERVIYPSIVAFQTVPKVAIAPIVVIWFGFGLASKVAMAAMIAFFPVIANTLVGLRVTPAEQIEMMVAFAGSRGQIFWKLRMRNALPYIFAGLDIAIVLAVIGAIVGEFVGAQGGLGYLILQRNFTMDMAGMFAILVVLAAIGMILHGLTRWVQRKVIFWIDDEQDRVVGA